MPTKVHDVGVKPKSTTVDELTSFLGTIESRTKLNKRCWPGSFFKPLQSDESKIVGQPIADLKGDIVDLALKIRLRLNSQADRTEVQIASESVKTAPSIVNSGYEIQQTDRYFLYNDYLYCRVGGLHLHSTYLLFITHHILGVKHFPESKKNIFLDKIKHIGNVLSGLYFYKPYMITDGMMGIENKLHTRTFS